MQPKTLTSTPIDLSVLHLDRSWIYKITVLADLVARRVGSVVTAVSELNLSQWRVLAALADKPGRTASEVVAVTPMDKTIVSRAVKTLIDRGFVQREASQRDGRRSHLRLTSQGEAVHRRIAEALIVSGAAGSDCFSASRQKALLQELDDLIERYG